MTVAQRRFLLPAIGLTLIFTFFITTQYINPSSIPTSKLSSILNPYNAIKETPASQNGDYNRPPTAPSFTSDPDTGTSTTTRIPRPTRDTVTQQGGLGTHVHVKPVPETLPGSGIPNCEYPILIHVTPDAHCTGALALYASIVRNVLQDPNGRLGNKTCVHFTYVDEEMKGGIEEMYRWKTRGNPYSHVPDCELLGGHLDTSSSSSRKVNSKGKELNSIVPVRWQALTTIEKPSFMQTKATWLAALNKVHSWSFDLYPRILLLDADSMILQDLDLIFTESDPWLTIAGGVDQYPTCHDRARLNGGMILLRPSRYFHIVATELLYDPSASCLTGGTWQQSEQELLNCMCGYTYVNRPFMHPLRSEFRCGIMPMYNSVWPRNYACSDAVARGIRSVHFTASPKPWTVEEGDLRGRFDTAFWGCMRDGGRGGDLGLLRTNCTVPDREVIRKVKMEGFFVL